MLYQLLRYSIDLTIILSVNHNLSPERQQRYDFFNDADLEVHLLI